ncbi:MAG TPA: molybdopterin molybdenumtransferase MoeA [Cycloclasticus sp.]|jgi:molybdopterin molybdotransferase|nr:molybdopterin molybdotransferase MoeA [Cycloclasticus sp.]HIL92913.1 molybdopterin molybdenumtransferase MoeA [Cycloclasticus sp.]
MSTLNVQSSCGDENEQGTLSVTQALNNMLNAVQEKSGVEQVHLTDAVDRILAQAITSPVNVPSHRNSAVDGYAVMQADLPTNDDIRTFKIAGRVVAGHPYKGELKQGECIQIMTGAQMPELADTVIMQEHVEVDADSIRIDARHSAGQNVRQAGEDIQMGQTVLQPGIKLTPPQIGLCASLGISEISVKTPLTAAVFSTGDEVLSIGDAPREGCIYDSNRYSMISALKKLGCKVLDMGIIADDPDKLRQAFKLAASNADVIFTSGGVSVGEADYTKQVLSQAGAINFWKVAMKPGRPVAFGKINNTTFFGLPGNPVAVMVTFYQFALPCLQKMMGLNQPLINPIIKAQCTTPIRKIPGRTEFQRGILSQSDSGKWQVSTTGKQGSGILRSMSNANAFIILEHERASVKKGEWVSVQTFSGLF